MDEQTFKTLPFWFGNTFCLNRGWSMFGGGGNLIPLGFFVLWKLYKWKKLQLLHISKICIIQTWEYFSMYKPSFLKHEENWNDILCYQFLRRWDGSSHHQHRDCNCRTLKSYLREQYSPHYNRQRKNTHSRVKRFHFGWNIPWQRMPDNFCIQLHDKFPSFLCWILRVRNFSFGSGKTGWEYVTVSMNLINLGIKWK